MKSVRGFFAGSGLGAYSDVNVVDRLLRLTGKYDPEKSSVTEEVRVAYIGTATYDLPSPQEQQTQHFIRMGCNVQPIRIANTEKAALSEQEIDFMRSADILLVSGGNTLYAMRRWEESGMASLLAEVAAGQTILAGGSAGAICWFTSGHSDSANPSTYMKAMVMTALGKEDELTPEDRGDEGNWSYIRVHGLNLLPGMLCPHYDVTQGNRISRSDDFERMLRRHRTERGIAIDHWAVLILTGDGRYEVFPVPGKTREAEESASTAGQDGEEASTPSVFVLDVVDGQVQRRRLPSSGSLDDLLRPPSGPLVLDPFELFYAMANPSAASGSLVGLPTTSKR